MSAPPRSEQELLARAQALGGWSLAEAAAACGVPLPADARRAKGWIGELLEKSLGSDAGSRPLPDFVALGIELKTIPVDDRGLPRESTYVCIVPLLHNAGLRWENSLVRRKLSRVLWVPVRTAPGLALAARRIGQPFLWSPSATEEAVLKTDWEDLMELVAMGGLGELDARIGTYLQIRPKAQDSRALTGSADEDGVPNRSLPRGFYLRTRLTRALLADRYARTVTG